MFLYLDLNNFRSSRMINGVSISRCSTGTAPIELWPRTEKKKTKVITYYILGQIYYILRYFGFLHFGLSRLLHFASKLLHFGLLLHFASKVITFWVNYYILWRNNSLVFAKDLDSWFLIGSGWLSHSEFFWNPPTKSWA